MFGKLFLVILSIETHPESNLLCQQCEICCEKRSSIAFLLSLYFRASYQILLKVLGVLQYHYLFVLIKISKVTATLLYAVSAVFPN